MNHIKSKSHPNKSLWLPVSTSISKIHHLSVPIQATNQELYGIPNNPYMRLLTCEGDI